MSDWIPPPQFNTPQTPQFNTLQTSEYIPQYSCQSQYITPPSTLHPTLSTHHISTPPLPTQYNSPEDEKKLDAILHTSYGNLLSGQQSFIPLVRPKTSEGYSVHIPQRESPLVAREEFVETTSYHDKTRYPSENPPMQHKNKCRKLSPSSGKGPVIRNAVNKLYKYPLLSPCQCRKKCFEKISENHRKTIHNSFWDLDYSARKQFIFSRIKNQPPKNVKKIPVSGTNRLTSRQYYLTHPNGETLLVCQKFFLATLGYKNDKIISHTLGVVTQINEWRKNLTKAAAATILARVKKNQGKTKHPDSAVGALNTSRESKRNTCTEIGLVEQNLLKYPVLPPCNCRKKCIMSITSERRKTIHLQYWLLAYGRRKQWILSHIENVPTKKPTNKPLSGTKRSCQRQYSLTNAEGVHVNVCQKFFLGTLGYTNDKIIVHTMALLKEGKMTEEAPVSNRGRHTPKHALSEELVKLVQKHIVTQDLNNTVLILHSDFLKSHPGVKISYESYRTIMSRMNLHTVKSRKRSRKRAGKSHTKSDTTPPRDTKPDKTPPQAKLRETSTKNCFKTTIPSDQITSSLKTKSIVMRDLPYIQAPQNFSYSNNLGVFTVFDETGAPVYISCGPNTPISHGAGEPSQLTPTSLSVSTDLQTSQSLNVPQAISASQPARIYIPSNSVSVLGSKTTVSSTNNTTLPTSKASELPVSPREASSSKTELVSPSAAMSVSPLNKDLSLSFTT